MTIPDAVLGLIVAAIPGGVLASTDADQVFLPTQVPVYDGIIPNSPPSRYVIVYIDPGTREALAACGQHDSKTIQLQANSVAPDGEQVRWLADKVADIVDVTPQSPGWACGPMEHTYAQRPQRDETVAERPAVYQISLFKVQASKA